MKAVQRSQILSLDTYDRLRSLLRPLLIAEKDRRRLQVGEHLTLMFENAQTVWYQVQEMLRTERITSEAGISHELDTYNELLPGPNQLAATLMLEYPDPAERDLQLRQLVGFENHLWLRIGERRQKARFDLRQLSSERVSSVHFIRFPVAGLDAQAWLREAAAGAVAVEADHPHLNARAALTGTLAATLAQDLVQD